MNISEIFAPTRTDRLEADEERDLLAAAQLGDDAAKLALARAYAPLMKSIVSTVAVESGALDRDDLQMQALVGLLSAIEAFDPAVHRRLAAIAPDHVRAEVSAAAGTANGFTVPARTLKRFFAILRAAEGNVYAAVGLAPGLHMTRETFLEVLSAVRGTESLADEANDGDPLADGDALNRAEARVLNGVEVRSTERVVEDEMLAAQALGALHGHPVELDVVRLAYAFADYDPYSDSMIAGRLGMTKPTVQRTRTRALDRMRVELGVA